MEQLARGVVCDEVRFQLRPGGVINEAALMLGWGGRALSRSAIRFMSSRRITSNLVPVSIESADGAPSSLAAGHKRGWKRWWANTFGRKAAVVSVPARSRLTLRRDRGLSALSPQIEDGDCRCICTMENRLSP
jgi:hypothetical protein